jgi:hypothetical protein
LTPAPKFSDTSDVADGDEGPWVAEVLSNGRVAYGVDVDFDISLKKARNTSRGSDDDDGDVDEVEVEVLGIMGRKEEVVGDPEDMIGGSA